MYGILYNVLFVALLVLVIRSAMRHGFVSELLRLCGTALGIFAGVWAGRTLAPALYRDHLGPAMGKRVTEMLADQGVNFIETVKQLPLLPQTVRDELVRACLAFYAQDTYPLSVSRVVPAVSQALQPMVLPIVQALLFLVVCLAVRVLVRILVRMTRIVNKVPLLGGLNRTLGGVLGICTALLDCWLLAMGLWLAVRLTGGQYEFLTQSVLDASFVYRLFANFNPFTV